MRTSIFVVLMALSAASAKPRDPGAGLNFYSKSAEIAAGQNMARDFRRTATPLASEAVSNYVNEVGAKLAAQFPGWTYHFEVVREDMGGATHEPAAFPGGPVFVSAELIAAARNEAEFAGMLAHAMAHVAARHWSRNETRMTLMGAPTGQGVPLAGIVFERACERQADYLAVNAMTAAGYDPAGLAAYLARVQPKDGGTPGAFDPLPARDERAKDIRRYIDKLPVRVYESSGAFDRAQAQVLRQ